MFAITRAAIRDCHEEKCTYRSALLGWAMLGMFLFRRGSVNALDAQHPIGSAHPSWLREVSGLPPDEAAEAPCGELLRYWAGRLDAEVAAEPLRPSRLSCYGRWHLTVVVCKEISPMPYDGRFVTDLPCPDATAASRIATCGRKRWWIESQNQTQKHLSYGLKHNYRNKSNASKVFFVFLLLATPLWEVFYKLGLRHWQPDTRKMPEESWGGDDVGAAGLESVFLAFSPCISPSFQYHSARSCNYHVVHAAPAVLPPLLPFTCCLLPLFLSRLSQFPSAVPFPACRPIPHRSL